MRLSLGALRSRRSDSGVGRSLDPLVGPWRSSRAPLTRVRIAPDGERFARHGTYQGVELVSLEQLKRKNGEILWRVRWRDARGRNRSRVLGRKRDAEAVDVEIKRRKRTGDLEALDAGRETLDEYVAGTWSSAHPAHLRPRTRQTYASTYDLHISPRLGGLRLRQIDAEVIAGFQGDLQRGRRPPRDPQGDDPARRHPAARGRVEAD
jgi:hypothetical protein